ncbi:sulfotransferase family protein [Roseixanthobacter glucoisosaccharinicivorans]|uniref:sulfotransferase family protein n=1 Tax=Roseixanthobacter glucoisosaccharinicivorans TaxID=3119923 RepID=UPI003727F102
MTKTTISVGCIGGSGSRVVARILKSCGYFIGEDLNEEMDNLWFTLLFKRLSVLVEELDRIKFLYANFYHRMRYGDLPSHEIKDILANLSVRDRIVHDPDWLAARMRSFLNERGGAVDKMAWKEPNTHIVVDRLLTIDPDLRYIHITRSGLDMAYSANLNQLLLWGATFLDRPVVLGPRDALSYWVAVEQRMRRLQKSYPGRILIVSYEELAFRPKDVVAEILHFCGESDMIRAADAAEIVIPAGSIGRHKSQDLGALLQQDVDYAKAIAARSV